jgi:hypothetical protein
MDPPARWFTPERIAHLKEHGYVIIPGVVAPDVCAKRFENVLEYYRAWDPAMELQGDSKRWSSTHMPTGTVHGITGVGHLAAQWETRQDEAVVECFEEYWGTKELVVSFDRLCFYHKDAPRQSMPNSWRHSDQGPPVKKPVTFLDGTSTRTPLEGRCLQGYLCLTDSTGEDDGCLVVNDKGHRAHAGFFAQNPQYADKGAADGNWVRYTHEALEKAGADPTFLAKIESDGRNWLSPDDPLFNSQEPVPMRTTKVRAPVGSMVFWYSRTPHENCAPKPSGNHRAVIYVCMAPSKWLTEKDIANRVAAWEKKIPTSHWPCGGQTKVFPPPYYRGQADLAKKPRIEALGKHPLLTTPTLTPLGMRLLKGPSTRLWDAHTLLFKEKERKKAYRSKKAFDK